ncbi:MAG TPA: hypothetical protein VJ717_00540 [Gemmatimonadaceae bacterium]|nr:hypothetical protein [Gemmatimonadaceae bacterium]
MAEVTGTKESRAVLQVWGQPSTAPSDVALGNAGLHAIAFTGRADLGFGSPADEVKKLKDALDDGDDEFSWDLDITVGPEWRKVKQVAPLVVVAKVWSNNTDEDDRFIFDVEPRTPAWSAPTTTPIRIVLHVRVTQAGEHFSIDALHYSVTATGELRNIGALLPTE